MTVLVTGARGAVARSVIHQLNTAGVPVRAASRQPSGATGVKAAHLDFTQPDGFAEALAGVSQVFLYAALDGIDDFIAAARDSGVERFVLLSSAAVDPEGVSDDAISRMHLAVEEPLRASNIPWTFIRPAMFAGNALQWQKSIREEGLVRMPYPEALVNPIHEADIAEVAVEALTGSGLVNTAVYVDGPEPLSQRRQVELIGLAIGRDLGVEELSREAAHRALATFMPQPELMLDMLAGGETMPLGPTSETVTGLPSRTFAQWAVDHAADFA